MQKTMKKLLSIILAILMIVTTIPFAFAADVVESGNCGANGDNLTWSLDSDGVLTISGEGEMQEIIIYAYQPWEDYDYDIKEVVIEEGVTKIARAAFFALRTLEKVTVSSTAKFEDFDFCFRSCTSLKEFIVSPANPYYCTDEYGVVFSKDKKTLLKAFDLSDVDYVIPDTVTSVADEAFRQIKIKSLIVNYTSMNMAAGAEVGKLIVDCDWVVMAAFESATIGELVLTNKVRYIENLAFLDAGITSAHYLGDSANLNIGEDNDGLTDVLHYCEHKEALVPTCTAIGWEAYEYCTECDYTTKVEIPVDPDAHDWSNKDGICARENCGYECVHANYADGACDNCDVKQKYTVRMETKLSKGVEFVGNPVAIHGEDLIIEFKNLVSEKCNDVSLFELTIGANSFYEFEFDENGITFDGTVLTIPGELVNGDVETHANAYTQARIKLNGGKFSPECPPDIVEEYFIENDYAISNKMLVGYNNSVKDTFVKDKHTIKSILASDGNDYNKIYYFSPNSDLEMTIEWECLPENFENGVCVECGYECPHEWSEGSLVRPTRTEEGYYTYTCSICKDTKTELVERPANYAEFKELLEKVKGYLDENLTDSMMQEVNNIINFFDLDENHRFIKGEENTVSQNIRQISEFVEVVEEGIADGTAVKVDGFTVYNERGREWLLKFADEGIFEKARELILNSTEVKAKMDEIYDFALSLEGNVAENAENIAKIEADVDEFFGQLKKCVYGIHNVSQYKEISPAKCGENAVESATCTLCGETVTREVENSALKHSFTKYEVTEEAKCGVAGKEVATCDNGCGATDEKEIEALRHSFTKYEVTEEAKCGVEGKEVAACDNGCGATDEKAIVALTHTDADGDYKCDNGCGHEFEKPAPEEPTPDTPDEPTDDACDHLCHKGGFVGFIWKIVKFFWKLFKMNPVCECGAAHY